MCFIGNDGFHKNGFLNSRDPSSISLHVLLPAAAANRRRPHRFAQRSGQARPRHGDARALASSPGRGFPRRTTSALPAYDAAWSLDALPVGSPWLPCSAAMPPRYEQRARRRLRRMRRLRAPPPTTCQQARAPRRQPLLPRLALPRRSLLLCCSARTSSTSISTSATDPCSSRRPSTAASPSECGSTQCVWRASSKTPTANPFT